MSTSKLQREVRSLLLMYFPSCDIEENTRPVWLTNEDGNRIELDFYIEHLGIALEIQGDQHFRYVPFFHKTLDVYNKTRRTDAKKKDLCTERNIELIEIYNEPQATQVVKDLALRYYSGSIPEPRAIKIIMKLSHLRERRKTLNKAREKVQEGKGGRARKKKIKWLQGNIYAIKQEGRKLTQELENALGYSVDLTELDKMIHKANQYEV